VVICLERGADLHIAQRMPLPLAVSCFSKIQIGFASLVLAHLGSPGKGPLNGCVCVGVCASEEKVTMLSGKLFQTFTTRSLKSFFPRVRAAVVNR